MLACVPVLFGALSVAFAAPTKALGVYDYGDRESRTNLPIETVGHDAAWETPPLHHVQFSIANSDYLANNPSRARSHRDLLCPLPFV
jgi:hypothetical protein